MIPIRLTIEGLYSYQKRQIIDFERLTQAHLFGIFGQVGSGKSSVLEAISFAIYGETERLNTRDSRGYNMMNLKSDNLLIEFVFESGISHRRYLATATARRNSKRFEDVGTIERKAFVDSGGRWLPVELAVLEEAVGLSYANFKRTIIIPQGKFKDFLELGATDRTKMMKELFGLEKYDLADKAARLSKANDLRKENIEGQLLQLGEISAEKVAEQKLLIEAKRLELARAVEKFEEAQKQEATMAMLKDLFEQQLEVQKAYAVCLAQGAGMQQLEQQLKHYESCLIHFKGDLESQQKFKISIRSLSEQLEADKAQKQALQAELKAKEVEIELLKVKNEGRDSLLKEADDLEKRIQIAQLTTDLLNLRARLEKGEKMVANNVAKVELHQKAIADVSERVKQHRGQLPDRNVLALASAWHTKNDLLLKQQEVLQKEMANILEESKTVASSVRSILEKDVLKGYSGDESFSSIRLWIANIISREKESRNNLKEQLRQLEVHAKLKEYAASLIQGEPCPLCGSTEHPSIISINNVDYELQQAQATEQLQEERLSQIQKAELLLVAVEQQLLAVSRRSQELAANELELKKMLLEHQREFKWDDYRQLEALNSAQQLVLQLDKQVEEQELRRDVEDKLLKKALEDGTTFRNLLETIRREHSEKESAKQTLLSQLTNREVPTADNVDTLKKQAVAIRMEVAQTSKLLEEALALIAKQQQELGNIDGRIHANGVMLQKEQEMAETLAKQIADKLEAMGYASVDEVAAILSLPMDVEHERRRIETYRKELQTLSDRITQLASEIGDRSYNAQEHLQLVQVLAAIKVSITEFNQEIGRIGSRIEQIERSLAAQKQLVADLNIVKVRGEELTLLKNLFYRSGFVNFISTTYLQNLCAAANDRFYRMTRQRLSLELNDDNNFQVRDYMNGGRTRNVKTLSGGQTFQASLALALALSDNIQKMQSADQNFFFLDEGFGTLDKDSLGVVFDTLKSLRKENRIVGVISHVDEMQQEIETYLKVVNHEESGSLVQASWE
ncbi:AAA family ATPase [Alistipes sp. ZOR0009]|uniref:AAA family ATPase n=1 Tax=Alistipes sp. ZOR0009 TaxID=1339253 RepID=UPI0006468499|nr:SMC family ATPase [Alistipes sp. ZOR0009]